MYYWGYLKEVILAKLDLTEDEANEQNLISRFPYYANEVITQICSAIKPKWTFAEFKVVDTLYIDIKHGELLEDETYESVAAANNWTLVGKRATMPNDFISFGDDVNLINTDLYGNDLTREAHDKDFRYLGYNQLMFSTPGIYQISYNARWVDFNAIPRTDEDGIEYTGPIDDSHVLDIPMDILDCIPPYVASQCFKFDDQYKSQVYRNEYEMALARIDNTNYKNTKTFTIGGDW